MAAIGIEEKCSLLARVPLFAGLERREIEWIATAATSTTLRAREHLFDRGDEGTRIYVLVSGRLKVISTSEQGDDLMFCVLDPGDVVGEVALLTDRERSATVVALQASELLAIDRHDFSALLWERPGVGIELLSVLARRLARVSEFVEDTQFLSLPVRLAKKISDFLTHHGVARDWQGNQEVLIDLTLSQEEWGDLIGATRESVNKQLRAWADEGLIGFDKRRIVVRDVEAIRSLGDCIIS